MLWHKAQGAGGAGGGIEYIGSVTKAAHDDIDWNSSGEAPDVMSLASVGDLVVIAFTADNYEAEGSLNFAGMSFTQVFFDDFPAGVYVGYRFVQSGDANPYLSGYDNEIGEISSVLSVFRGVSSFVDSGSNAQDTGFPEPPSLTANGNLWIATGHIDDDLVDNFGVASPYTMADSEYYWWDGGGSSTAIAYRIETLSSTAAPSFFGLGNDYNVGLTLAFD